MDMDQFFKELTKEFYYTQFIMIFTLMKIIE